jgi:GTP-binding protein
VEGLPPADPAAEAPELPRLAFIGKPNVGKSSLTNAPLGQNRSIVTEISGTTRDAVDSVLKYFGREIVLVDTAGLRRKPRTTEKAEHLSASDAIRAIRFAEAVVLLTAAPNPLEHQDMTIASMVEEEGRALVLAVNKWDIVTEKQKVLRDLREMVAGNLAQLPNVSVVTVSALAGTGVDKLKDAVFETYEGWNRRIATPALNRWLAEAMDRHTPPATSGRRIKIRYMTQPSARPPTFIAFCSQPNALPRSYVRYLTNSLRETFKLPGVPIRFRLRKGENPYAGKRR